MPASFSPSDMPQQRRPVDMGPITEGHEPGIRQFAWFPFRGEERLTAAEAAGRAWPETLKSLAEDAESEDWGSLDAPRPYAILDNYLRYTYRRLVMEDKIVVTADGIHAAFNTGLLTKYAEEIFGFFTKNQRENAQRWVFAKWATESDTDILRYFPEAPKMAEYVSQASDLVYDWRRELKLAYNHILGERIDRFPPDLAAQPLRARQALDSAIEWTLRRARRNYKVIVPQWYPKLGDTGAQFLLPLDLTGDGKADLALVVSAIGDYAYRGHTVLDLSMAYTNARLVARPDSDWLLPAASPVLSDDESA